MKADKITNGILFFAFVLLLMGGIQQCRYQRTQEKKIEAIEAQVLYGAKIELKAAKITLELTKIASRQDSTINEIINQLNILTTK